MKKRRTNASAPRQKRPEKTAREQAWQRFLRQNTWLVLLLVLGVTSLQGVKRRMDAGTWKRLQKWAYVFFGLVYVHLMSILLPSALAQGMTARVSIAVYTVLFGLYAALRIARAVLDRKQKEAPELDACAAAAE